MFTWGSKFFFGLMTGALLGAVVYGLVTGGGPVGVVSAGYKGGVGDHLGYTVLAFAMVALFVLGLVSVLVRDGDAETMAARAGVALVPAVRPPSGVSYWGPITAFGVAALVIGLALSKVFFALGIGVLAVVAVMWAILAWSDRATGDHGVNQVVRSRMLGPIEIPMLSMLAITVVAVAVSRIFLTVSKEGAVVAGSILTIFVFAGAVFMAKVDLKKNAIAGIVAFGAFVILVGGIVSAAVGPRSFEEHPPESESSGEEG